MVGGKRQKLTFLFMVASDSKSVCTQGSLHWENQDKVEGGKRGVVNRAEGQPCKYRTGREGGVEGGWGE